MSHPRTEERPDVGRVDGGRDSGTDAPRDVPPDVPVRRDTPLFDEPCSRDGDCARGSCVLDTRVVPLDEMAVALTCGSAGTRAPGAECDANDECENGLCALAGGCVEPCIDALDCRAGERCTDVPVVTGASEMQVARACVRWVDVPSGVTIRENADFPVSPFGTTVIDVPAASRSRRLVLALADRQDMSRYVSRVELGGVGGTLLSDAFELGFSPQINPAVGYFDSSAVLIPNAPWPPALDPRAPLAITISQGGESEVHRIVFEHDGAGATLDLNVFWVGTPSTTRSRAALERVLSEYQRILETIGVRLGRVRQFSAAGAATTRFAVVEDYLEVGALFQLSAGAARPAVNVFLVSTSPEFLGVAGGVPGAMGVHGTQASGIALSWGDLLDAIDVGMLDLVGVVLAHEVGHFAGLFHTSEMDGLSYEPLPDTGSCGIDRDTDGDGALFAFECLGAGGDNIMFWAAERGDSTFSTSQGDIIGAAPVLLP